MAADSLGSQRTVADCLRRGQVRLAGPEWLPSELGVGCSQSYFAVTIPSNQRGATLDHADPSEPATIKRGP